MTFDRTPSRPAPLSTAAAVLVLVIGQAARAETPGGQEVLFNGADLDAFEASPRSREHWRIEGGVLRYDGKDTHLWTKKSYRDCILRVDWRFPGEGPRRAVDVILPSGEVARDDGGKAKQVEIQYGGDSGIYLRGNDKSQVNIWNWPIGSGEVWGYRTDPDMPADVRAGVTPKARADRPLGEWNSFTILMKGDRLTVDLNGVNVIASARLPGVPPEGRIALQHHGDPIEFREIYVRELPEGLIDLFDGQSLKGWKTVGAEKDTWTAREGKLVCAGKPNGYIRTEMAYGDYVLEAEYRFVEKGGSTGLLLHVREPDRVWPASIEIQLDHKLLGNFIRIGDVSYEAGPRSEDREKPAGQWNRFRATCRGDTIEFEANGKKVSEARKCSPAKGTIGFQSEGVPIEIRNIWLVPLKT
jgi:hypothetical protein